MNACDSTAQTGCFQAHRLTARAGGSGLASAPGVSIVLVLIAAILTPPAFAQQQEERMREILVPTARASEFSGKTFDPEKSVTTKRARTKTFETEKKARVRPFAFLRRSRYAEGDGARTKASIVAEKTFSTKASSAPDKRSALAERAPVSVEPAREEGHDARTTREYPFLKKTEPRGSRQDTLDAQFERAPALTIDQVRELLNKPK